MATRALVVLAAVSATVSTCGYAYSIIAHGYVVSCENAHGWLAQAIYLAAFFSLWLLVGEGTRTFYLRRYNKDHREVLYICIWLAWISAVASPYFRGYMMHDGHVNICEALPASFCAMFFGSLVLMSAFSAAQEASNTLIRARPGKPRAAIPAHLTTVAAPATGGSSAQVLMYSNSDKHTSILSPPDFYEVWRNQRGWMRDFAGDGLPLADARVVGIESMGWPRWNVGEQGDARCFADGLRHYLLVTAPTENCVLLGLSRGCATVFNALTILAEDPLWESMLKKRIERVILLGPFARVSDVTRYHFKCLGGVARWFATLRCLGFRHDWKERWAPIARVEKLPDGVPIAIVVANKDFVVPADSGLELARAIATKKSGVPLATPLVLETAEHNFWGADHDAREALFDHVQAFCATPIGVPLGLAN
jgi:pimeloyl-ACP methyl ester carboxylesterase